MNGNGSRGSYRPTGGQMRFNRRHRDQRRNILIGIISVLSVAVAVFGFLVLAEIFNWFDKAPEPPVDIEEPEEKFKTTEINVPSKDVHAGELILVNSSYPYVFPETKTEVIPIITDRTVHGTSESGNNIYSFYTQNGLEKCAKLEKRTLELFRSWTDDFYKATGNSDLFVFDEDGYRTKEAQEGYYSKKPAEYAAPGTTEHHMGTCTDLYVYTGKIRGNLDDAGFADIFKWIYDNAYRYGFVLRYPESKASVTGVSYEPYHFRQVGYAHAYYMSRNDLCLEEYLELIKNGYTAEAPLEFNGDDGNTYMVYYVAASEETTTSLTVPEEHTYTYSGDNKNGFIVTVKVEG